LKTLKFAYKNIGVNIILSSVILAAFTCCSNKKKEYVMATSSPGATYNNIGKSIAEIWEMNGLGKIKVLEGTELNSKTNCLLLIDRKADFAFVQNDTRVEEFVTYNVIDSKIRTVLPVYPEILFIVYHDSLKPKSLKDMVMGRNVAIGPTTSGTARFMKILFKERIDKYYIRLLEIEQNVENFKTNHECERYLKEITELRRNAFKQLINEKLIADESFRIFINLAERTIELLKNKTIALEKI